MEGSGRFRRVLSDNLEKYLLMLHVSDSIISTYLKSTTYLIISPLNGQRWVIKMDGLLPHIAIMETILFTFLFQTEKICLVRYVRII